MEDMKIGWLNSNTMKVQRNLRLMIFSSKPYKFTGKNKEKEKRMRKMKRVKQTSNSVKKKKINILKHRHSSMLSSSKPLRETTSS